MIHGDGADLSMAQVCGEREYGALTFVPGVDFDPFDHDECEHVRMASESDAAARIRRLEQENADLRAELASRPVRNGAGGPGVIGCDVCGWPIGSQECNEYDHEERAEN